MIPRHRWLPAAPRALIGASLLAAALTGTAQAQSERTTRIIVPFAAGGTVDIVARILGAKLADMTGGRVVVDNRGGAGGIIGTEAVAKSPGDGSTLLVHSAAITYDPTLHDKLPYDTLNDLAPVAMLGTTPNLLVVPTASPLRSVADLIARGRDKPGSLTFATGGFGSSSHFAVTLLSYLSGARFNHVPYKGAGPALADVVAGHVDFTVATMPGAIAHVRGGRLRALGISSRKPSPELPEVPAIAEAGLADYEYVAWFAVFAPGTTPAPLIERLNAQVREALDAADTRARLRNQGVAPEFLTSTELRAKVKAEIAHWAPIIIKSGMKGTP